MDFPVATGSTSDWSPSNGITQSESKTKRTQKPPKKPPQALQNQSRSETLLANKGTVNGVQLSVKGNRETFVHR